MVKFYFIIQRSPDHFYSGDVYWVRSQGVIPILGATKLSQIQDNLACLDFQLSPEHIQKLDEVSKIELGFPHHFLARTRGATFGGTFELIDNHRN